MRRSLFLATGVLLVALGVSFYFLTTRLGGPPAPGLAKEASLRSVQLNGRIIHVLVAETPAARSIGLGGRMGLAPDEGMLFVFPADGVYAFWMKDMKFSIDILWLSADGTIVSVVQHVSPDTFPATFRPDTPARYVLELPAGYVKAHTVSIGDIVRL